MNGRMPLGRFVVLDLSSHRSGPTAARQLADWGAQVIRIEAPNSGDRDVIGNDRHNPDFQNLHRNKRSMRLDLKSEHGKRIFFELVRRADVVIENFRSNVKFKLGIDYDSVRSVNPRIVYGSISGFGQDGPYAIRPGVDQIAQGIGGLMSITGLPGQGPVRVGIPIADLTSGLLLSQGILMALLDREKTGAGQWVTTSLLEAQVFMLDFQAARWLISKEVAVQAGNDHPTGIPSGVFPASDGKISIAAPGEHIWQRLCETLEAPELLEDPNYRTGELRSRHRAELNARIAAKTESRTSDYWVERLNEAGCPAGPINSIDQVFADRQVQHLGIAKAVHHHKLGEIAVVGQPLTMSSVAVRDSYAPAPESGEHTDQVLLELGYEMSTISELRNHGVI